MTTIDPPLRDGGLGRELGLIKLDVADRRATYADPWARARVRMVIDAVALEIVDDVLVRLAERIEEPDRNALNRFRQGEPGRLSMWFLGAPIRLDRERAALAAGLVYPDETVFEVLHPLASNLVLTEGSIKGAATVVLSGSVGVIMGAVILPGVEDSRPGALGKKYVTEAIDAAWDACGDLAGATRRALDRLDIEATVDVEGDRVTIVIGAPDET